MRENSLGDPGSGSLTQYHPGSDNLGGSRGELLALYERGPFIGLFHRAVPEPGCLVFGQDNALAPLAFRAASDGWLGSLAFAKTYNLGG